MSANLATTADGRAAFAFTGAREDIWHRMGQQIEPGMDIETWLAAAGLNWTAQLETPYLKDAAGWQPCSDHRFIVRSDTRAVLGHCTPQYQPVQPRDVLEWFTDYVGVDDRFQLDAAGALGAGEKIWATATFNGGIGVAGAKHVARLLMSTSFDGTQATRNQGTMTRVVCQNTLRLAQSQRSPVISTRHSTKFNAGAVAKELAAITEGFAAYKAMGEALALVRMAKEETSQFFKTLLDIPFDAKSSDVTARKMNQFHALVGAYGQTVAEGTERNTKWCALNAVTRYVDHDRSVKAGSNVIDFARFQSANFGTGDAMKQRAVALLQAA